MALPLEGPSKGLLGALLRALPLEGHSKGLLRALTYDERPPYTVMKHRPVTARNPHGDEENQKAS